VTQVTRRVTWQVVQEARVQLGRIHGKRPLRSISFLHTSSLSYRLSYRVLAGAKNV
jgi:hypothetical protein